MGWRERGVVFNMNHDPFALDRLSRENQVSDILPPQHAVISESRIDRLKGTWLLLFPQRKKGSVKTLGNAVPVSILQVFTDGQYYNLLSLSLRISSLSLGLAARMTFDMRHNFSEPPFSS